MGPKGSIYIRSANVTGMTKDAELMAKHINELILEVGAADVVQVLTDNAAVMVAARSMLQEEYPHIIFGGCAAHVLDLLLEDIGKESWCKAIFAEARELVKFITSHEMCMAAYERAAKRLGVESPELLGEQGAPLKLKKFGETRFGTMVILADRLLKMKLVVQAAFDDEEYVSKVAPAWAAANASAATIATKASFWRKLEQVTELLRPAYTLLRAFDGDTPCTGKVYYNMYALGESLKNFRGAGVTTAVAKRAFDLFSKRWVMLHTEIHDAGFCLDPEFWSAEYAQDEDKRIKDGLMLCCERILGSKEKALNAFAQWITYRDEDGVFANEEAQEMARRIPAFKWWRTYGAMVPELQEVAMRVLAQPASSSASERVNSEAGHIKSIKRSRMKTETMQQKLCIYHNLRFVDNVTAIDYEDSTFKWGEDED